MTEALMKIKKFYTEKEKEKLLWFNWNRMSLLTNLPNCNQTELLMRIDFQNDARNVEENSEIESKIYMSIEKSLTTKIKKEVNEYMKESKKGRGRHAKTTKC